MAKFDFEKLTPEQKKALREQLEAEERAEKEAEKRLKKDYLAIKDEQVTNTFTRLQNLSSVLEKEKIDIFNQFGTLISMKKEMYDLTEEQMELQQSHTFTTTDSKQSIIIGSNVIDRWGDDVNIGIERVNKWIDKKIEDKDSRDIIRALMKPNKDGVLKANRVLELSKKAREIGDSELIDAVNFIHDQYQPVKTSTYVKAKYLDKNGIWQWLALSMSSV